MSVDQADGPVPSTPRGAVARDVPKGFRIRLSHRVTVWRNGTVLIGGSPWRISRVADPFRHLVRQLQSCGAEGLAVHSAAERAGARVLLDRGFALPMPDRRDCPFSADVVVPAFNDDRGLAALLPSLEEAAVTVIDDGSDAPHALAIEKVAAAADARIIRHARNSGPASARNTGLRATSAEFVAFIDADCVAPSAWLRSLLGHFSDPAVAAVAPRIRPAQLGSTVLERYETSRSSLDMGPRPELVRPGAHLGFVPSAALVVRRSALADDSFDPALRLGEDVDLIWRLAKSGWLIRYDPDVVVTHRSRTRPSDWLGRRYQYGTSAPDLEARHPGSLVPVRAGTLTLATLLALMRGRPLLAAAAASGATLLLWSELRGLPASPALAARTVGLGIVADGVAVGRALRREWWPLGWGVLILSARSATARRVAMVMLAPVAAEWVTQRPPLDPVRYVLLRLADDAAYGSGVLVSSVQRRCWRTLTPRVSLPKRPGARPKRG